MVWIDIILISSLLGAFLSARKLLYQALAGKLLLDYLALFLTGIGGSQFQSHNRLVALLVVTLGSLLLFYILLINTHRPIEEEDHEFKG